MDARLRFLGEGRPVVSDLRVDIPGDGVFGVPVQALSRWRSHVDPDDVIVHGEAFRPAGSTVHLGLVLSRISYPATNALVMTVDVDAPLTIQLALLAGRYSPISASEVEGTWRPAAEVRLPAGRHEVRLPMPWAVADLSAYPTNFLKVLQGRQTNAYHAIHVKRLEELYEVTRDPVFEEYAQRWRTDICAWSRMDLYEGLAVRSYWTPGEAVVDPVRLCRGPEG
jgi:D-glucuronyl C5-epimerase C-terminus